jgi:cysteinyl-tRNA synthetase
MIAAFWQALDNIHPFYKAFSMSSLPQITLFDSYKKEIIPISNHDNITKIYSCGPTVYQYQHIGNMRAVWLPDTFARVARIAGYTPEWVMNITDVGHLVGDGDDGINISSSEDKLEKSAQKEGRTVLDIVTHYTNEFHMQCSALNFNIPTNKYEPYATQYIEEQMILALTLLKNKKAYLLEDGIYFDSEANADLQLPFHAIQGDHAFTGRDIENTTKNPSDFALWKFVPQASLQKWRFNEFESTAEHILPILHTIGETVHDLPNRYGCPGWHSECVTMICSILGGSFPPASKQQPIIDVHFGGEDHIDIHHKNEILQSASLGFTLSAAWVHNKFVLVDKKKMSKSVGNVYLVQGEKETTGFESIVQKGYDPLAYRLMLFEHHYTQQLDFTWEKLEQSQARLYGLRKEVAKICSFAATQNHTPTEVTQQDIAPMIQPLCDNLNTPKFLDVFQGYITHISNTLGKPGFDPHTFAVIEYLEKTILDLGLLPYISREITDLANKRSTAKGEKNYVLADKLRQKIESHGYQIDDMPWGYSIWVK